MKLTSDKLPSPTESDFPFDIPESWVWVRLEDVCSTISDIDHRMPKEFNGKNGIPYISPKDFFGDESIDFFKSKKISYDDYLELSKKFTPRKGDIIFPRYGTIGKIRIIEEDIKLLVSYSCACIRILESIVLLPYIKAYLLSPLTKMEINKYINKTTQPNVGLKSIQQFIFPLPPLNEQKRIVAKLEELLPFIEEYDKKEQKLTALNQQFPEQLKKSILQSAIQGKLVEQDPNDEPASKLIKRIQAEKKQLILEKKIKKTKVKSEIIVRDNLPYEIVNGVERCIADEVPFEIPENWCWVRLENITAKITDGSHNPPSNKGFGIPLLSAANIFDNKINFGTASRWISNDEWITENKRTELDLNDILLTIVGTIGRTAIVKDERKFALQRSVAVLKPILFYSQYLSFTLQTPYLIERMIAESKGTAQKGIYLNTLKNLYIPLPPVNEQKRIVQRIEELFSYIQYL